MSRVYFYPKCALESQHWTVWACLQPQKKCELQPNPHISQHNFLLHHHHQKVWFSGRSTRVALTCSMQMTFDKSLRSLGLFFLNLK